MVVSSAQQACDNANAQSTCDPGYCLKNVRQWHGIPSREADAADAWATATGKHAGDKHPPKGAPLFWTGGSSGHGHIAIARGNDMRTTDKPTGKVGNDNGAYPRDAWGLKYVGWAEGYNGVKIPWLEGSEDWRAGGDVYVSKLKHHTQDSQSVSRLRYRLTNHNEMPDGKKCGYGDSSKDGANYTDAVVESARYWMQQIWNGAHGTGENFTNDQANVLFGDKYNVIEE